MKETQSILARNTATLFEMMDRASNANVLLGLETEQILVLPSIYQVEKPFFVCFRFNTDAVGRDLVFFGNFLVNIEQSTSVEMSPMSSLSLKL